MIDLKDSFYSEIERNIWKKNFQYKYMLSQNLGRIGRLTEVRGMVSKFIEVLIQNIFKSR